MAGRGSSPGDITIYCAICERILVIYIVIFSLLGVMRCQRERAGCPRGISPVDREQRAERRKGWDWLGGTRPGIAANRFFWPPPMTGFSCQGVGRHLEAKKPTLRSVLQAVRWIGIDSHHPWRSPCGRPLAVQSGYPARLSTGVEPSRPSSEKVKGPVLRRGLLLYLAVREG